MLALNLNELPRRQESPLQDTLISPLQHDDALNGVKNQLRRLAGSSKSPLQPPPFSRSKSTTICENSNTLDPSTQTKESSPNEEPSERLTNFQQRYLYYRSLSQPHLVVASSNDPPSPPKMTSTPSFLAPTLPPKTSKWSISPKTELHPIRSMLKKSLSTGSISVDTSGWDFPGIARRENPEQNNIFLAAKKNILTSTDFPIHMSPPPLSTKSGHTPLPTSPKKKKPKAKKGLSTPPTSPPPPRFQSFRTALRTSPSYRVAEPLRTGRPRANTADGDVSSPTKGRGRHLLKRRHVSASALLPGFPTNSPPPQVKSPRGGDKPLKSRPSKTETKKKTKSKTKKHSHRRDEEEPRRRHKKSLRQKEISTQQYDEEESSLPCRSPVDQELGQLLRTVERSKRKLSKDRLHDFEELLKVLSSYQHDLDL